MENLGHRVLNIAHTRTEAIELAKRKRPGLILAEIQLSDGSSGLDAVNELVETTAISVIFITAYPERFLTGNRPEPAFLVAKPFRPELISVLASQVLFFHRIAGLRRRKNR
jgi:CheY-like chemotaxis protein